jgi:hypothetical protein
VNVLRLPWLVEPTMYTTYLMECRSEEGDCLAWSGEMEGRRCRGDLILTLPHECTAPAWNVDNGDYILTFSQNGTVHARGWVRLNNRIVNLQQ